MAAIVLMFCALCLHLAGEYTWRKLKAVHRLERLIKGLQDLDRHGKVYPEKPYEPS